MTATADVVVAAAAGRVIAVDAKSGAVRWRFSFRDGAASRIVIKGGRVHVASDKGSIYVLDVTHGRPLQYIATGSGVSGDLTTESDALFFMSNRGRLVALSNAWAGPMHD
jgi:outer membrane protein assembly factor BamB